MTERMIELYKEACEFAYSVCKEEGRPGGPSDHIWHTLSTGRFAELIVRECIECADIVGKSNLASGYPNSTAHHVKQKIQEHFGVE